MYCYILKNIGKMTEILNLMFYPINVLESFGI